MTGFKWRNIAIALVGPAARQGLGIEVLLVG